jgi:phage terminase large subunit
VTPADVWDRLTDDERAEALWLLPFASDAEPRIRPHTAYQRDPVRWAVEKLGIAEHTIRWSLNAGYADHPWDGTEDPMVQIADALARWESVGVESATGTGKSFWAAVLVLWFLACFEGARVFTFAAQEAQLRLYIWAEIGKLWARFAAHFPTAELTDLRIRMLAGEDDEDTWGAWGRAAAVRAGEQVSARAAGMHAKYLLLVNEETQGMAPAILEAQENTCTGPCNVRLYVGNPDSQHDALHTACLSPGVRHIRISALDHPNVVTNDADVIAGAVSRDAIERRADKYGVESPMYESRVRGISPAQSAEALIQWAWLEEAAQRHAVGARGTAAGAPALGVDVAQSENGDKAALAFGRGARLVGVKGFACRNATQLGRDVHARMVRDGIDPWHVGVDPVGVGAATVNALDELTVSRRVQHLNGGSTPMDGIGRADGEGLADWLPDANTFANLRAQMWWALREDLRCGRVDLPKDEALWRQLTLPKAVVKHGKTLVESKLDLRKRTGGKSPDEADAVVYWNWVRPRAVIPATPVRVPDRHPGFRARDGQTRAVRPADEGLAAPRDRVFGGAERDGDAVRAMSKYLTASFDAAQPTGKDVWHWGPNPQAERRAMGIQRNTAVHFAEFPCCGGQYATSLRPGAPIAEHRLGCPESLTETPESLTETLHGGPAPHPASPFPDED